MLVVPAVAMKPVGLGGGDRSGRLGQHRRARAVHRVAVPGGQEPFVGRNDPRSIEIAQPQEGLAAVLGQAQAHQRELPHARGERAVSRRRDCVAHAVSPMVVDSTAAVTAYCVCSCICHSVAVNPECSSKASSLVTVCVARR
jgi:hypothetical protein